MKRSTSAAPSHSGGLNKKLSGYSATAGAALLIGTPAIAQVYTINQFGNDGSYPLSSTPPAFTDTGGARTYVFTARGTGLTQTIRFNIKISQKNFGAGLHSGSVHFTGNLAQQNSRVVQLAPHSGVAGHLFGNAGHTFAAGSAGLVAHVASTHGHSGAFATGAAHGQKSGYVGFKTSNANYGWLKIRVTNDDNGDPASITFVPASDGLYGQIGDDTLLTPSAIPEPASVASGLGLLALGAAGVREMRRRRSVAA